MRPQTLNDWLHYQQQIHPQEIELGLDRVQQVWQQLGNLSFSCPTILVGGTNGKGSTVACLQSIYSKAGLKTACYTSPHILHYNERVQVDGQEVSDQQLIDAFNKIEQARKDTQLTYFEFGTLAALLIFHAASPDIMILEVGLGGRLDAVNIIEPDVSIITSVALDHTDWLGDTLDSIAYEKAGIARHGKPLIFAQASSSPSILDIFEQTGACVIFSGRDYNYRKVDSKAWDWVSGKNAMEGLPLPALQGDFQIDNCAGALAAIDSLSGRLAVSLESVKNGLAALFLAGRYEVVGQSPQLILDVAHNEAAAQALAKTLSGLKIYGGSCAVFAMQKNREIEPFVKMMISEVNTWYVSQLDAGEGHSAEQLAEAIRHVDSQARVVECDSIASAMALARKAVSPDSRIIVTGSFYTVAEAKAFLGI